MIFYLDEYIYAPKRGFWPFGSLHFGFTRVPLLLPPTAGLSNNVSIYWPCVFVYMEQVIMDLPGLQGFVAAVERRFLNIRFPKTVGLSLTRRT